jgi:hypothetical protein
MNAPLLIILPVAAIGLAALAPAQQFTEPHRMLPRFAEDINTDVSGALFADFDSDGDQDAFLAASSGEPATNRILFNNGDGSFRDFTDLATGPLNGRSLCAAVGDLDHDGDLDIYVGNSGTDEIWWNISPGRFNIVRMGAFTQENTTDVAIGDLDGDSFVDLFLTVGGDSYGYGDPDMVLLNDGFGSFTTPGQLPAFHETSNAVALGDVDGDGDLDAIVGNGAGLQSLVPHLFINQGFAVFTDEPLQIPSDWGEFMDISLVDVDADGDLDAILANDNAWNKDRLYLNQGNGTFVASSGQFPDTISSIVTILDSDGDGDPDALMNGTLVENDGNGFFTISTEFMPGLLAVEDSAAADIDGDGDEDLLIANDWESTQLLLNDGNGSYLDVSGAWPKSSRYSEAVDAGDVDGDGDIDLFFGREWGANELLLNDGTGRFDFSPNPLPHGFERTRSMDFADFDGDGDLDIFLTNGSFSGGYPAEPDRLYLNDGSGVFTDATAQLPANIIHSRESDLGDIDNDGDIDILIAVYESFDRIYLNDGNANFTDHSGQLPSPTESSLDGHLIDFDNDGDMDIYIAHPGQDRFYVNQGGAVFVEESSRIAPLSSSTYSVTSADVNADGFEDLVTGRYETGNKAYRMLINDGGGQFLDRTNRIPPSGAFDGLAVEFADADNDGDPDLYVATSSNDALFLNDGSGFFTDASEELQAHWDGSQDVVAADLDGDEDIDFAVAQGRVNQIYTNTLRQLSWMALPRADRTLRLALQGDPNSTYTLVGSAIPDLQELPAYGTLRLSYADRFIQVSGTLDNNGKAIWETPIVLPPSMAGATLYWQALLGSTPRLSNLETTEITLW